MRRGKFCPKCGKSTEQLHDNLCSDCFRKTMQLPEDFPEKVVTGTCKVCGKVFLDRTRYWSVEEALEDFLRGVLDEDGITHATYRTSGSMLFITAKLEVNKVEKEIEVEIPLVHKTITCEFCNLKKSKYYNVTLQIRVPKNMHEKIMAEVNRQIDKLNESDNYSFISAVKDLKEGTDLYIGSKSAASHVVKYLKQKYHVKTKISRTLFGPVEGKKIYRDTILISIDK